jgi:hypothetical protein
MATTLTTPISTLVQSQFPRFVQEDYPALIQFVTAYYEFLEIQKNPQDILSNLMAYRDIDRTLDEFVSKFETEYIDGLPQSVSGDKRRFIKHVTDLYNTKGTEESFRLLFRLLFGEEITLYYPKQQMLVASGGTWSQLNSIQVALDPGISPDCVNKKIKIFTNAGVINTYITNAVQLYDNVYEIFINWNSGIGVQPGNIVTGLNFSGVCQPTATTAKIISVGAGFRVGQVFTISSVLGTGAKVKVTAVDSNGGILQLAFIQFGTGYESDFQVSLSPNVLTSGAIDPFASFTNGFIESVLVTKVTYFSQDYVDITYSGEIIGSSYTNDYRPDNALDPSVTPAIIEFDLGALCAYRGEYTSAAGFLSDVNVIQDGYLYQDFSYVIQTKQKIQDFAAIVKKLVHPAGTIMFSEMSIEDEFDISTAYDYQQVLANALKFTENVTPTDLTIALTTGKHLSDSSTPIDAIRFATTHIVADSSTPFDTIALKTGKNLTDSSTPGDASIVFSTVKSLLDSSTPVDAIAFSVAKQRSDNVTPVDAIALNTTLVTPFNDTSTTGDSSIHALLVDYCDYTYLAGDYVGTVLM